MKDKVNAIKKEYEEKKSSITSIKTLNDVRVEYLGKQGKITELSKMMKDVPNDQKKEFGMLVNEVRSFVTESLDEIKEKYKDKNILLVTHGGTCRAINAYFNGIGENGHVQSAHIKNCEIREFEYRKINKIF